MAHPQGQHGSYQRLLLPDWRPQNWTSNNGHLASTLCKKTKLTAEQKERMMEFL
jgi:hypothetical protein